jgi:hypothetical protein
MSAHPWIKFYPRDWRGDQALRVCSLAARGLWIEMLCIMHEASPYGHLILGGQPVSGDVLARLVGIGMDECGALLLELESAGVFGVTRKGVVYSRRLVRDQERSEIGRKAKVSALKQATENKPENPRPSRGASRSPSTQKPDTRGKVEGPIKGPSTLSTAPTDAAPLDRAASSALEPGPGASLEERKKLADEMRQSVGLRVVSG